MHFSNAKWHHHTSELLFFTTLNNHNFFQIKIQILVTSTSLVSNFSLSPRISFSLPNKQQSVCYLWKETMYVTGSQYENNISKNNRLKRWILNWPQNLWCTLKSVMLHEALCLVLSSACCISVMWSHCNSITLQNYCISQLWITMILLNKLSSLSPYLRLFRLKGWLVLLSKTYALCFCLLE